MSLCPCHSGVAYAVCCKPYHLGGSAPTALALMRSRYSAYALKNSRYLVLTTHPCNPYYQEHLDVKLFDRLFQDLIILGDEEKGDRAYVLFTAILCERGRDCSFTEQSFFVREVGKWLYLWGDVFPGRELPQEKVEIGRHPCFSLVR